MTRPGRAVATLVTVVGVAATLASCGDAAGAEKLTVYSAQHESLVRAMLEGFTD